MLPGRMDGQQGRVSHSDGRFTRPVLSAGLAAFVLPVVWQWGSCLPLLCRVLGNSGGPVCVLKSSVRTEPSAALSLGLSVCAG